MGHLDTHQPLLASWTKPNFVWLQWFPQAHYAAWWCSKNKSTTRRLPVMLTSRTSFFNQIKESYGKQALQAARHYLKTSIKLARLQQHTTFNRKCRHYRLLPNCLHIKPLVRTAKGHKIATSTSQKFLGAQIQESYRKMHVVKQDLFFERCQLEFALQRRHFQLLEEYHLDQTQFESDTSWNTRQRKFNALLN